MSRLSHVFKNRADNACVAYCTHKQTGALSLCQPLATSASQSNAMDSTLCPTRAALPDMRGQAIAYRIATVAAALFLAMTVC